MRSAAVRKTKAKPRRLQEQRAVESERARIARNIHDDLGAHLTHITMLSDPERNALAPERARANLKKIHRIARELTLAMDETVWALDPQHDTFDSLVNYLQLFAQEFLESAGMQLRLEMPFEIPCWPLSGEVRHNLFLACKEALNNAVKHAAASEVRFFLKREPAGFALVIEDNGRGFKMEPAEVRSGLSPIRSANGNGLGTMQLRLQEIGGRCELHSLSGQGTRITFFLPIPSSAA